MKKAIIAICLCFAVIHSSAQLTAEKREGNLLEALGSFSAATLYNTYAVIGGITDGFAKNAYDAATVNDLMDSQEKMADNLIGVMENLRDKGSLKSPEDKNYATTTIGILRGLKKQAQLLVDDVQHPSQQNNNAYDLQRKKNWAAISKLMGLDK